MERHIFLLFISRFVGYSSNEERFTEHENTMERILTCPCGHQLEWHDDYRCRHKHDSACCACLRSRKQVVEDLVMLERERTRLFWLSENPTEVG